MKRFYNHQTIKVEEYDTFTTFQFNIEIPTIYGLDFYEELDNKMQRYIKQLNSDKPTLIQIVGDFDVLESADEEDVINFLSVITNLFVFNLTSKTRSTRVSIWVIEVSRFGKIKSNFNNKNGYCKL